MCCDPNVRVSQPCTLTSFNEFAVTVCKLSAYARCSGKHVHVHVVACYVSVARGAVHNLLQSAFANRCRTNIVISPTGLLVSRTRLCETHDSFMPAGQGAQLKGLYAGCWCSVAC